MRRSLPLVVRFSAALIGFLALLIGAAALIPRLSGPYRIAWLDDYKTCELPCWRGITPGITTFDDAVKLVRAMPDVILEQTELWQNNNGAGTLSFHVRNDSYAIDVSIYVDSSGKLEFAFINLNVPVPEIVARFGRPATVNLYEFNDLVSIVFPYPTLNLNAQMSLRNATRISSRKCPLDKLNATAEIDIGATLDHYHVSRPWKGFSAISDLLCAP